jgi:hypothetical protein
LNHFTVPVATSQSPLDEPSVSTDSGFLAIKARALGRPA